MIDSELIWTILSYDWTEETARGRHIISHKKNSPKKVNRTNIQHLKKKTPKPNKNPISKRKKNTSDFLQKILKQKKSDHMTRDFRLHHHVTPGILHEQKKPNQDLTKI